MKKGDIRVSPFLTTLLFTKRSPNERQRCPLIMRILRRVLFNSFYY